MNERPAYLEPYRRAAERHGAGFGSLLWASPQTQAARFEAVRRLVDFQGRSVLDVGCGRADFLDYLVAREVRPASYIGIEGVAALVRVARAKGLAGCEIVEADFLAEPARMDVAAQVVVISGSLNTLDSSGFYATLRRAYEAAGEVLVFNFLCSSQLAGADYLAWHRPDEVLAFARTLSDRVSTAQDYLPGDCTVVMGKAGRDEGCRRKDELRSHHK
jgi:SAM-dependent methyltransferase